MDAPKAGQKLHCDKCGTEIVVVKPPAEWPSCCDQPLVDAAKKEA